MKTVIKRTIGRSLKKKRIELQLSQEKMAEKCCISLRQYSDIENCLRLPKLENFFKIVIVCEWNFGDIISALLKNGYEVNDDDNAA